MEESISIATLKTCQISGIIHQAKVPFSPQHNGLAERMNRTIMERARSMINHMQVKKNWWAEAVISAICITNSVPCAAHPNKTPHDTCFKTKQNLDYSIYDYLVHVASRMSILPSARNGHKSISVHVSWRHQSNKRIASVKFGTPKELSVLGRHIFESTLKASMLESSREMLQTITYHMNS